MICSAFAFGWTADERCGWSEDGAQELPRPVWKLGLGTRPVRCAAGARHSLFVLANGKIVTCGEAAVSLDEEIAYVAAGDGTSYAVSTRGEAFAWDGQRSVPRSILRGVRRLACGRWHCAAITRAGALVMWGRNREGQLGIGAVSAAVPAPTVVELEPGARTQPTIRDVAAGGLHTVCIAEVRKLSVVEVHAYAWGASGDERLGDADPKKHHTPQLVRSVFNLVKRLGLELAPAPGLGAHAIVACGGAHTLVATKHGQLVAWGSGAYGQLGYGDLWDHEAVLVPFLSSVVSFSAGERHSIAIQGLVDGDDAGHDGAVYTWGFNAFGELGVDDRNVRLKPALVRALKGARATACAAGLRHSLVVVASRCRTFQEDARYQPAFQALADSNGRQYTEIAAKLVAKGCDPTALDRPHDVVPDQPGLADTTLYPKPRVDTEFRYCLDTVPPRDEDGGKGPRRSYEAVAHCSPCRISHVCRACVRHCHASHCVASTFVRWTPNKDRCGCLASGRCRIVWTPVRAAFDRLADDTAGPDDPPDTLDARHLRALLTILHPTGLGDDDVDAAEVALHSATGKVTYARFERWHTPYYETKRLEAEASQPP